MAWRRVYHAAMTVIDPEQQPQILLIDDDQKLTRLLSGFLQAQGFAVTVAHDGAQGLQRAKEAAWNLVILDVMLPRIDGFEVLTQLRRHSQIPVLMLTGRGGEDDMVAGLEGGADEYVAKTASSRELVTRIRALLRRAVIAGSDVPESDNVLDAEAVFGTLRIVPTARAVYVDGESVHLTNVEYELLVSLARILEAGVSRNTKSSPTCASRCAPWRHRPELASIAACRN